MKSRLPQTMGLELPTPGNATFQTTFLLASKVIGMFLSSAVPVPSAPRKRGQLSAAGPATSVAKSRQVVIMVGMIYSAAGVGFCMGFGIRSISPRRHTSLQINDLRHRQIPKIEFCEGGALIIGADSS